MNLDPTDHLLQRTLGLASRGAGLTDPNPLVGAVLVDSDGKQFQGFHSYYTGPHAEAVVLAQAGDKARGAVLYCSLEPCCHSGQGKHQPPCSRAIIAAGVARVVIGQLDPNPRVRGGGVAELRRAGISVTVVDDPRDFMRLNPAFNTRHLLDRPYVFLKAGVSLDGQIASSEGRSRWITGERARKEVHALRAQVDAVAVGVGTVVADDPHLGARPEWQAARPQRAVVFDRNLEIPENSRLLRERATELVIVTSPTTLTSGKVDFLRDQGVTLVQSDEEDLGTALSGLAAQGIQSLLVEGGRRVLSEFLQAGAWDELTLFFAPKVLGAGIGLFGDLGIVDPALAQGFEDPSWKILGDHAVFHGHRPGWLDELIASLRRRTGSSRLCGGKELECSREL